MKITIKKEDFKNSRYGDCYGCALWKAVMREFKFKPELIVSVGGWEINQNNPRKLLFELNRRDANKVARSYNKKEIKDITVNLKPTEFFKKNYGLPKTNT